MNNAVAPAPIGASMGTAGGAGPRVLLIAESANPEWTSVPLVGWSHAAALSRVAACHVVTQIRNKAAFERRGVEPTTYTAVDSEAVARRLSRVAGILRGGSTQGWTTATAVQGLAYRYFERLAWQAFEEKLRAGGFDVVHRLTPLSPTIASPIAPMVRKLGVPFVMGPLNGGVAWPKAFGSARRREKEWLSYVRGGYKLLPGYRSTRRSASAIICGSFATRDQMPGWCRDRCVYIPENAIDPSRFPIGSAEEKRAEPMRIAFVGRLVPYKGADMLIEACAPLIRSGRVVLEIIGDGPEAPALKEMVRREGLGSGVEFSGWVTHELLHERLRRAHLFGFPSVREFGGAVVLEAMALGVVPVVINYGGPGELVTPETGVRIGLGTRAEVIERYRREVDGLVEEPARIRVMAQRGVERVMSHFTWDCKARQVREVYRWVLGERDKPDFCLAGER